MGDMDLDRLIAEATRAWHELPRHEQIRLERLQKISWVYGQLKHRQPGLTRERVAEIVDAHERRGRPA